MKDSSLFRLGVATVFIFSSLTSLTYASASGEDELKTKDMKMQNLSALQNAGEANQSISAEQLEEIKKQMAVLKQRQEEAAKALEELDKE